MISNFYLGWIILTMVYNTLFSYAAEYDDFCLWNSDLRVIDGYYERWDEKDLINCHGIPPVWIRAGNGSYYSGDEGTFVTYLVLQTSIVFYDFDHGTEQTVTGYAFYYCDQIAEAFRQCSTNEEYCNRYPVMMCSEGNVSFSECQKWNKLKDDYNSFADQVYFNIQGGECPSYINKSAPIPDNPDATKSTAQSNSSDSLGTLRMEWTWALVAVSVVAVIVIIWSTIRVCRKYNLMNQYHNRVIVADEGSDDEDEIEPPKKKAPPVPIEMRTRNLENLKDGKEQLIPANVTTGANKQDFAIGNDSDLSDESV